MAPSVRLQRKTWLFRCLFLNPSLTSKRLFGAVDHNDYYPNWLQFYFTLLKEHGFLLIWGIVQETTKGDCSHCQRPHVIPVDPDSCESEKVWPVMNCRLLNVMSLTCDYIRKVSALYIVSFLSSGLCWSLTQEALSTSGTKRSRNMKRSFRVLLRFCDLLRVPRPNIQRVLKSTGRVKELEFPNNSSTANLQDIVLTAFSQHLNRRQVSK